jgi:hypothetical protein
MSGITKTTRKEPVYGEQRLRLLRLSRVAGYASYRYYRMDAFAATTLNSTTLDLTEIELFSPEDVLLTGITPSANFPFTLGSIASLTNGITTSGDRCGVNGSWNSTYQATARIDFDMGSAKGVGFIRIYSVFAQPRFPVSFNLSGSNTAGSGFGAPVTVTVGNAATWSTSSSNVVVSPKTAVLVP